MVSHVHELSRPQCSHTAIDVGKPAEHFSFSIRHSKADISSHLWHDYFCPHHSRRKGTTGGLSWRRPLRKSASNECGVDLTRLHCGNATTSIYTINMYRRDETLHTRSEVEELLCCTEAQNWMGRKSDVGKLHYWRWLWLNRAYLTRFNVYTVTAIYIFYVISDFSFSGKAVRRGE